MKTRKIRPDVFLKAAKRLEKELAKGTGDGSCCCYAIGKALRINCWTDPIEFKCSPEFILFKKMFGRRRIVDEYWFGETVEYAGNHKEWWRDNLIPHVKNQQKRIKALMKAYKAAKKMK